MIQNPMKNYRVKLVTGLTQAAHAAGLPFCADSQGGMFGFFLMEPLPQNYATVMTTDGPKFNAFFHAMLDAGVYFAPALYEAGFVSAAHTDVRCMHRNLEPLGLSERIDSLTEALERLEGTQRVIMHAIRVLAELCIQAGVFSKDEYLARVNKKAK
jgi:hypothetical protein